MRILFSTYSMAFQNPGGGEQVLFATKKWLESMGHKVQLYDPWQHQIQDYDVVHYFSCIEEGFWNFVKKSAPSIPLLVTPTFYHEQDWVSVFRFHRHRIIEKIEEKLWSTSSAIEVSGLPDLWFPTTHKESQLIQGLLGVPKSRIHIIPNGVELRFAEANASLFCSYYSISEPFVLHVGRFHPVKNQLNLIEAIKIAGLHGVFIGSPDPDQEEYYLRCLEAAKAAESSDLNGKTKYTFIPRLEHEDPMLASAYAAASVFALPSQFETFGIAALEAALSGCALVLTRNLQALEVFKSIAQLIDPDNPVQIAEALKKAMMKAKHAKQDKQLIDSLIQQYSWQAIASKLSRIYLEALPISHQHKMMSWNHK